MIVLRHIDVEPSSVRAIRQLFSRHHKPTTAPQSEALQIRRAAGVGEIRVCHEIDNAPDTVCDVALHVDVYTLPDDGVSAVCSHEVFCMDDLAFTGALYERSNC